MELRAAAATDVGRRRRNNEDALAVAHDQGLFLVADGMGGHTAGQVASETAAREVLAAISGSAATVTSPSEQLRAAVAASNDAIFQMAKRKPELQGMGTTLVALLSVGGRAALAHVGDSRAYLVRRGRIRQLTDDHSLVGELQRRGELTAEAAQRHPHRHVLTRALGVRRGVEPDLAELSLAAGDVFVLCTDGLTTHVKDEEIAELVESGADEQTTAKALIDLANERGGEDNVTVVIMRCAD